LVLQIFILKIFLKVLFFANKCSYETNLSLFLYSMIFAEIS